MQLTLKDEEAHRLAEELAHLTGESMTEAVLVSLRERLDRERRRHRRAGLASRLVAMGYRVRAEMTGPPIDHGELLYDGQGLPR